jgi:ABC-type phosphate transport system substrate-binding protein
MRRTYWFAAIALLLCSQMASAGTLVVIVNPASKVERLTRYQVLDIFLGRYRSLPTGIPAMPIDLKGTSAERQTFYRVLARKDLAEISSYWARLVFSGQASPPYQVADVHAALELVASNPSAIAYVDSSVVDRRVKVVLELTE